MINADDKDDLIETLESCIYRLANHFKAKEFRAQIEMIVEDAITAVEDEDD